MAPESGSAEPVRGPARAPGRASDRARGRAAIVLAGGRGSRLGGTSKALMRIDGRPALTRVVEAAVGAGRDLVVVVGPDDEVAQVLGDDRVRIAIEPERFGGPAVAVAAGVAELRAAGAADDVLVDVLACDLVHPDELVEALDAATRSAEPANVGGDGVVLVDDGGRVQWLAACIRLGALARALDDARAGDGIGRRLGTLDLERVSAPGRITRDIDTPSDLTAYGAQRARSVTGAATDDSPNLEEI